VCIGLQTGIAPRHALSAEYGFRPLFASLEGVPQSVIYATDDEFEDGQPNAALREKIGNIADAAIAATG
jgi:hypothetical protein